MGLYSSQIRTDAQLFREGRTPSHEYYLTTGVVKQPTVILHDATTAGAKTVNADGTVSYATISTVPATAPATANIIAFSGGKAEIGGAIFDIDSSAPGAEAINLDEVARFLSVYNAANLGPEYVIAAVPKYAEPVTIGEAQASGVYYTVSADALSGELVASYHIDPIVQQDLLNYNLANPGNPATYDSLSKKRMKGTLTKVESELLRSIGEAYERLRNGRVTGNILDPIGVAFVLASVQNFPSYPSGSDNFVESDETFKEFYGSYVGSIPSKRLRPDAPYEVGIIAGTAPSGGTPDPASDFYVNTTSFDNQKVGSSAAPGLKFERLASITLYETAADALAGVNGYSVGFTAATKEESFNLAVEEVTAGSAIGGLGWTTVFAVVNEFYVETFSGSRFNSNSQLTGYIQKENVAIAYGTTLEKGFLGHLNPVYLNNNIGSNVFASEPNPKSQLSYYADPCPLVKIRIGVCDPVAGTASIDTTDLWAQGGTASFETVYGEFPTSNLL
jgi:hypothetical protein